MFSSNEGSEETVYCSFSRARPEKGEACQPIPFFMVEPDVNLMPKDVHG